MSMIRDFFLLMVVLCSCSTIALAQSESSVFKIEDAASGVAIEFDQNGEDWVRIYSTASEPVLNGDPIELQEAYDIAADEARVKMARFAEDNGSWDRIVSKIYSTHISGDNDQNTVKRERMRQVTETMRSSGIVKQRGVLRLAEFYDKANSRVKVTMGFSRATAGVARSVQSEFERKNNNQNGAGLSGQGSSTILRTSPNYPNNF